MHHNIKVWIPFSFLCLCMLICVYIYVCVCRYSETCMCGKPEVGMQTVLSSLFPPSPVVWDRVSLNVGLISVEFCLLPTVLGLQRLLLWLSPFVWKALGTVLTGLPPSPTTTCCCSVLSPFVPLSVLFFVGWWVFYFCFWIFWGFWFFKTGFLSITLALYFIKLYIKP